MWGVADLADELGVSERRVRQLLECGALRGRRLGGTWIVAQTDLEMFREQQRPSGRPWSAAAAWAAIGELTQLDIQVSPVQRSRARQRVRDRTRADLLPHLRRRAAHISAFAHPAALRRLERHASLVLAGTSAAPFHGADIIATADGLDAYVSDVHLPTLIETFSLQLDHERPNIVMRAIPAHLWPFEPDLRVAPIEVVAFDLAESPDERIRRAGLQLLVTT